MHFTEILEKYRRETLSSHGVGDSFERLIVCFLRTYEVYDSLFENVWQWRDFPYRASISPTDTGIDIAALDAEGGFWAVQCKCYQESQHILKSSLDSFIALSSKKFALDSGEKKKFSRRLLVITSNNWSGHAEEITRGQDPPFSKLTLFDLENARVDWKELDKGIYGPSARTPQHELMEHQKEAVAAFHRHFKDHERGKLILPCGTGKTLTALKIAEKETNGSGLVLFLAPSIALVGQTLREWSAEAKERFSAVCVCSDSSVSMQAIRSGRAASNTEDIVEDGADDLPYPASTSADEIVSQIRKKTQLHPNRTCVIFSTYQSIQQVADAVSKMGKTIDLIVSDEAHRTTGQTTEGKDESSFVKVHDQNFLPAKRRLYMTATPRIYGERARQKADQNSIVLFSMDDLALYGEEVYRMGFGKAVRENLLSDYKVLVITVSPKNIPKKIQKEIEEGKEELTTDDDCKFYGCIHALSKRMDAESGILIDIDPGVMTKAVAFCNTINNSKIIAQKFEEYSNDCSKDSNELVVVEADHVDGAMGIQTRERKMSWLKSSKPDTNICRILSNVRCLSEGVDVPSLDAVLFLSQKNSEIDVVQSVGRVMRKSEGKKFGYIIIPVVVAPDASPESVLNDNKTFKVVWTVLNALKAHDDRFNAVINQIRFNERKPDGGGSVLIGQPSSALADSDSIWEPTRKGLFDQMAGIGDYRDAVYAKLVKKVGSQSDMRNWAAEVGDVAKRYVERINIIIKEPGEVKDKFQSFLDDLRENLNPSVDAEEAVRMLSQHMVTKPVFEALFKNYSFAKHNPVSISLEAIVKLLEERAFRREAELLEKFYDRAGSRISALDTTRIQEFITGIDNSAARQKIIVELYDKFFKLAFPDVVQRLGVVYTPVEVVDFIVNSVAEVLEKEFGRSIQDKNIHILDPFTGTGTFITRLIQSGLLGNSLPYKYKNEIHANEIVLLAYYIASINIENVYHAAMGENTEYSPFHGICLTDTFQLFEDDKGLKIDNIFKQNTERVNAQKKTPIMVVFGNPPYSAGQKNANDNMKNIKYSALDMRITETYAEKSTAVNKNILYDSYIRGIRWASDRIDTFSHNGGLIAFVTNAGWLDGNAMDGMRKCIAEEFSSVYIFDLRGNALTSGELRQKEGGNIFGQGSRTHIAVTILIKKPETDGPASIYYCDIGDYLTAKQKLEIVSQRGSIYSSEMVWETIIPNQKGDWINQGKELFSTFIPLGHKKNKEQQKIFFSQYSSGLKTARDSWCYNFSGVKLQNNIKTSINFYNEQRIQFHRAFRADNNLQVENFIDYNKNQISWSRSIIYDLKNDRVISYNKNSIVKALYRPFVKMNLYFNRKFNDMVYRIPAIFPTENHINLVICVDGIGGKRDPSAFISNAVPDLNMLEAGAQCFPRYYYEEISRSHKQFYADGKEIDGYIRHDAVTDYIFQKFKSIYGNSLPKITKSMIFYYVYGILHSPEYRRTFSDDLKKMLPRIPFVRGPEIFQAFSDAGRALAKLHINFETLSPFDKAEIIGIESGQFHIDKMRFAKGIETKFDKTVIHYNSHIKIAGIPLDAYDYTVNGRSPMEWVMDRAQVMTDKDSGIKNDPNDWAEEHGDPRYYLDLILRLITVSLETQKIVKSLPKLRFSEEKK